MPIPGRSDSARDVRESAMMAPLVGRCHAPASWQVFGASRQALPQARGSKVHANKGDAAIQWRDHCRWEVSRTSKTSRTSKQESWFEEKKGMKEDATKTGPTCHPCPVTTAGHMN